MWPEARRVRLCTQAPFREDRSAHAGQRWRRSCSLFFALWPYQSPHDQPPPLSRTVWPQGCGVGTGGLGTADTSRAVGDRNRVNLSVLLNYRLCRLSQCAEGWGFSAYDVAGSQFLEGPGDLLQVMTNFR